MTNPPPTFRHMSSEAGSTKPPAAWQASLARSKAQIAAGQSVPLLPVLDRLRASAERLEASHELSPDGVRPQTVEP